MTAELDVFGWQADESGCSYYRIELPFQALEGLGYATARAQRMPVAVQQNPDVTIVGQRVCLPEVSLLWQQLAARGRKLIYEIDDDLLTVDASSPIAHSFFARPDIRANVVRNIEVSSAVTVTTEPLADMIRQWNPNVHVIPNAVPDWMLDHQPPQRDGGILTIGWGGSATHQMDFEQAADQLRRFITRTPDTEFHCMGSNYAAWIRIPPDRSRFTPWLPGVEDYLRAIDFNIGVAPLRPHLFNQAKSAIKAQEAAALGIPIVASAVRPYEDFVEHGRTGFLVRRDHEWAQYLRALVNDPQQRSEMGAAARVQAADHTISRRAALWEKAILG